MPRWGYIPNPYDLRFCGALVAFMAKPWPGPFCKIFAVNWVHPAEPSGYVHMEDNPTQEIGKTIAEPVDDLTRRILAGDADALAVLFEQYRGRLRRVVDARLDRRLKGRVDPSDVLHEAWLNATQRLPAYLERVGERVGERAGEMSLFVWMRLVASECVLNAHRKHLTAGIRDVRRDRSLHCGGQTVSSLILANNLMDKYRSAGTKMVRKELQQMLMLTLEAMDPIDQEVIMLRSFEELTNVETAQALGLSPTGASNRFVRAMTRLRNRLASVPGFLSGDSA